MIRTVIRTASSTFVKQRNCLQYVFDRGQRSARTIGVSIDQSARRSLPRTMPDLPPHNAINESGAHSCSRPREDRCPGSRNPPSSLPQRERTLAQDFRPRRPSQDLRPRRPSVNILKRIPRASRGLAARKLPTILDLVSTDNSPASWDRLFQFAPRCLRVPKRGGHRRSLASHVNQMIREEADPESPQQSSVKQGRRQPRDPLETLSVRVASKLEEGDFKGQSDLPARKTPLQNPTTEPYRPSKTNTLHPTPTIVPLLLLLRVKLSRYLRRRWLGLSGPSPVGQRVARMGFAHNTSKT